MRLFVVFTALITVGAAFSASSRWGSQSASYKQDKEIDAASLLHHPALHHNELFSNAVRILESMRTHPSCNRLAASDLLTSCQSFKAHDELSKNDPRLLDTIKSFYAARLALCELEDAGTYLPDECIDIASHRHHDYKPVHLSERAPLLEPCLRTLESKPQWWTSYSNNRQNTAIMCEAARIEIDKEKQLETYRDLANVTALVADMLNETYVQVEVEKGRQVEFMKGMERKREDMFTRFFADAVLVKNVFEEMMRDAEKLKGSIEDSEAGISRLSRDMTTSAETTHKLDDELTRIYDWVYQQRSDMIHAEKQRHEKSLSSLSTLQNRLDELNTHNIHGIVDLLDKLMLSLNEMGEAVRSLNQNHNELDLRLQRSETAFKSLETISATIHHRQLQHLQEQSTIQESFQKELALSRDMLIDIEVSAHNLKKSLDDVRDTFSSFVKLGGVVRAGYLFVWLVVIGICVKGIRWSRTGSWLTGSGLVCLGVLYWAYNHFDTIGEAFNIAEYYLLTNKQTVWALGIGILAVIGVTYHLHSRRRHHLRGRFENLPLTVEKRTTTV